MAKDTQKPRVEAGEWISIGDKFPAVNAVVSEVYENRPFGGDLEVVYLERSRAINTDVIWNKDHWEFKNSGPSGGYADNSDRLSKFVQILRAGRNFR